ncbi:MAG: hypothetical protein ACLGI5_08980 [Thermoleophilia bacterium]
MIGHKKSRTARAGDLITRYLKFKAIAAAAKGAGKTARKAARGKPAQRAQRPPKKAWLALAGGAGAAALVARKVRHGSADPSQPTPA